MMTRDEMVTGFKAGRRLIQEEWADPLEIQWVDQLVEEGLAEASPWRYHDSYQCERRIVIGRGG